MPNAPAQSPTFQFYTRRHYFKDLRKRIDKTTAGRILITTMVFDPTQPDIASLCESLERAARRGLTVYFAMDAYDFIFDPHIITGPLWRHTQLPEHLHGHPAEIRTALQRLQEAGVRCAITNQPGRKFTNPFAGRSHIKMAVVNDYQYVGGCNLERATDIDCMVGWHDQHSADWLFAQGRELIVAGSTQVAFKGRDRQLSLGDRSRLLLDAGAKGQSVILDEALAAIDRAQKWIVLSCQYYPNDVTLEHLLTAHRRGVQVRLVLNDISQHQHINKIIQPFVKLELRRKAPASFFATTVNRSQPYMHAKILATEQEALTGSHNLIAAGVDLGTAELALHCRDTHFSRQLASHLVAQAHLASNKWFGFLE